MALNLTAPGVYIEDLPSGTRTIVGVSTSVTAFIGRARRGPLEVPVPIESFGEFERQFGGLWQRSELGHAVRHFFQNGGRSAIVVRVESGGLESSGRVPGDLVIAASDEARALPSFDHLHLQVTHGGGGNDYTLTIRAENAAGTLLNDGAATPAGFSVVVPLVATADVAAAVAAAVTATVPPVALARVVTPVPLLRPATTNAPHVVSSAGVARLPMVNALTLEAANRGTWGDDIEVTVTPDASGATFTLAARLVDPAGRELENEVFHNLTLATGAVNNAPSVLASRSALVRLTGTPASLPAAAVTSRLQGGSDGLEPDVGAYSGSESARTGLHALDAVDVVNLLCVPFPIAVDVVDETERAGFWSGTALPWCRDRGAFAIIDPPPSWASFDAVSSDLSNGAGWMSSLRSAYGAQYFPMLLAPDPLQENRLRAFGPGGAMAGIIARTDGARGVWKAPAGTDATVAGALDLSVLLTDGEQGVLNRQGVNCMRAWPGAGRVLWGTRTLLGTDTGASEWKYIPVRRLASYLQQSLLRGTRWAVFEGNDEALWSQLRLSIGGFMQQLFQQGAFVGKTPSEAYFVKCDKDTTTAADIDAGIVNVRIGFAPVKPAEFVVIKIQQLAGSTG